MPNTKPAPSAQALRTLALEADRFIAAGVAVCKIILLRKGTPEAVERRAIAGLQDQEDAEKALTDAAIAAGLDPVDFVLARGRHIVTRAACNSCDVLHTVVSLAESTIDLTAIDPRD